jgi:hypothetical protein
VALEQRGEGGLVTVCEGAKQIVIGGRRRFHIGIAPPPDRDGHFLTTHSGSVEFRFRAGAEVRGLVFGGGKAGVMGSVSLSAKIAGVKAVGVIPDFMVARQLTYLEADELILSARCAGGGGGGECRGEQQAEEKGREAHGGKKAFDAGEVTGGNFVIFGRGGIRSFVNGSPERAVRRSYRSKCGKEMTELVIHLAGVIDGQGDLGAQEHAIALAQAVQGDAEGGGPIHGRADPRGQAVVC